MLQGSLYETLTRKINRPCNFSYLTCVDIILSGGPSTFFFYFKVRAPRKLFVYNRAPLFLPHHLFCFRTNFLLSNISLCYPSCAFFFKVKTPRKLIVHNRAPLFLHHHLFCFRTNFLLSNIFLCYPSCAFFSSPSSAVIILNTASSRVPVYLLV